MRRNMSFKKIVELIFFLLILVSENSCMEEGEVVHFDIINKSESSVTLFGYYHNSIKDTTLLLEGESISEHRSQTTGGVSHDDPFSQFDSLLINYNDSLILKYKYEDRNDTVNKNPFNVKFYKLVETAYDHHISRSWYEYYINKDDFIIN
jgi:hypothetical protein